MHLESIPSIEVAKAFCTENFIDSSPFLDYSFFKLLEESQCTTKRTGWIPNHIVIKEKKSVIGFIPNFKKLNSYGEYIFDHVFENAHYQIGSDYFPKYLSGIPFTPVTRLKFIYSKQKIDNDHVTKLLVKFLEDSKVSSFHANFIDSNVSNNLEKYQFVKRIGIQYHWTNDDFLNFNDFLDSMKSRKKKSILKERNFLKEQNIDFIIKEGENINEDDIDGLYGCYLKTIEKKWSRPYLNLNFFKGLIKTQTKSKIILVSAFQDKKLLGCSIHFLGNDTLYGRYWGCLKEVPYLHFELCYYQAIEYAIKKKIKRIEAGAQGEHKISRGYLPNLIFSNHWFNNKVLEKPIKDFIRNENEKVIEAAEYLKKYSPFSENGN